MKIYLSSREDRREELKGYRAQLQLLGHEVLGSWLDTKPEKDEDIMQETQAGDGGGGHASGEGSDMSFGDTKDTRKLRTRAEMRLAKAAEIAYEEILDCEIFAAFTDTQNHTREASYAEFGGALFTPRVAVWIVGGKYHKMHYYKDVTAFPTFDAFKGALAALDSREQQHGGRSS